MLNIRKIVLLLLLTFIIVLLGSFQVLAQPNQGYLDYNNPEPAKPPNLFWELIKVVFSLAIVLGVAYLIFQFLSKRSPLFTRGQFITIIENTFIAPNKSISIVEVGNRFLIVGVTEQNITLLTEITDNQVIAIFKEKKNGNENDQTNNSFEGYLASFLSKVGNSSNEEKLDNTEKQLKILENSFGKQISKLSLFDGKKEDKDDE